MPYVVLATVPDAPADAAPLVIGAFNHWGRANDVLDYVRTMGYVADVHPLVRGVDVGQLPEVSDDPPNRDEETT